VLPDHVPKPIAPVAGRPFLHWLLDALSAGGLTRLVVSVGWRADAVEAAVQAWSGDVEVRCVREETPLGTGGALRLALNHVDGDHAVACNGDTIVEMDLRAFVAAHLARPAARLTVACVEVEDTSRYGGVLARDGRLVGFSEKGARGPGLINAGVYGISRALVEFMPERAHSFERDVVQPNVHSLAPRIVVAPGRFIDIGVPEDLQRAQFLVPEIARRG
jgi:D-glycero-alpha-D-manno-heptose 1-phosphate guanylyltransferase